MSSTIVALPSLLIFVFFVLVEPTWRVKRQTGVLPIAFRRSSSVPQKLVGVMFLLSLMGLLVWTSLVVVGAVRVWAVSNGVTTGGWALVLAGFVLSVAGQRAMGHSWRVGIADGKSNLVTHGVFTWVRNPVFSGIVIGMAGFTALTPGWTSIALLLGVTGTVLVQVRYEERHLLDFVGEPYAQYAQGVGRFVPGIGKLRL